MKNLGRKAPAPTEDVQVLRDYLQQFDGIAILQGRLVTATILAGHSLVVATHGLGRAFKGAFPVGTNGGVAPFSFSPDLVDDPTTTVSLCISALSANDTVVSFWVF